jgi:hypothetical protein
MVRHYFAHADLTSVDGSAVGLADLGGSRDAS